MENYDTFLRYDLIGKNDQGIMTKKTRCETKNTTEETERHERFQNNRMEAERTAIPRACMFPRALEFFICLERRGYRSSIGEDRRSHLSSCCVCPIVTRTRLCPA